MYEIVMMCLKYHHDYIPLARKYLSISNRLLKVLFEHFPTIPNNPDDGPDDLFFLPLEEGIFGQQFYIPALYEVLCIENSSIISELKRGAGFRKWGSLKRIGVGAVRYEHRHARRRWVLFGSINEGIGRKLPFVPADLQ